MVLMRLLAIVTTFAYRVSNYVECVLWVVVGGVCLLPALKIRWRRGERVVAAITFVAFGLSDWVESFTGAWWSPWWLLVWKGGCVAIILALAGRAWSRRRGSDEFPL